MFMDDYWINPVVTQSLYFARPSVTYYLMV